MASWTDSFVFRWGARRVSMLLAFATILIWSSSTAVSKIILSSLTSLQVMFFFSLFTVLVLAPLLVYWKKVPLMRTYSLADYATLGVFGLLGVFLYIHMFNESIIRLPAQVASILHYLWPLFAVVFTGVFFGEKFSRRAVAGLMISFVGVILVVTHGDFSLGINLSLVGIALGIASGVSYGLFSALAKRKSFDPVISTFCYFLVSLVCSFVFGMLSTPMPTMSMTQWAGLFWLGPIVSGLGFILWLSALRMGDISAVSNVALLAPFLSLVYISLLVHEAILPISIAGAFLIVVGIFVQARKKK